MGRSSPDGNGLTGTGKTPVSIAVTGTLYEEGRINRVLIVAPLSILGVWEEEFERFADFSYKLIVLNGTISKKIQQLKALSGDGVHVAVVNYESAWRMEKQLIDWHPDLIIADEGHKIKTHNTSVSKAMHRLGLIARYRLLLTGTVITNKAIDVFSQYKFIDPRYLWKQLLCLPQPVFQYGRLWQSYTGAEKIYGTGFDAQASQHRVPGNQGRMSRSARDYRYRTTYRA
jgi:SNF2 family DNA or RNA helicase